MLLLVPYAPGLAVLDLIRQELIPLEGCKDKTFYDIGQAQGREGLLAAGDGVVARIEPGNPPRCVVLYNLDTAGSVDMDASGRRVVVGINEGLVLMEEGRELWRAEHPPPAPADVAISLDGRWVAAGAKDHTARVWDANTGKLVAILKAHQNRVSSVDFSPDGKLLATGSWDGTVRFWSTQVFEESREGLDVQVQQLWGISLEDALGIARK